MIPHDVSGRGKTFVKLSPTMSQECHHQIEQRTKYSQVEDLQQVTCIRKEERRTIFIENKPETDICVLAIGL